MPYYYYGYGDAAAQSIYLVVLIPVLLLSFWAQTQVNGNFKRYSRVMNARRITGAQAAEMVLRAHGVRNVRIAGCSGTLSDHYDPRNNTIYLSNGVYDAATIAAVGVAAHEAGHAVQHAEKYLPVKLRMAIIPITNFCSKWSMLLILFGVIFLYVAQFAFWIMLTGIIFFATSTLFQLITLPVEFNASARAMKSLRGAHIFSEEELDGSKKVLRAAAMTYVAALATSLLTLVRLLALASGGRNRR